MMDQIWFWASRSLAELVELAVVVAIVAALGIFLVLRAAVETNLEKKKQGRKGGTP